MKNFKYILLITFSLFFLQGFSTTWDEPWQDEIIKQADYFILAKVISCDRQEGLSVEISKSFGDKVLKGTIEISDFYLTHICSMSAGHGTDFHFSEEDNYYFFLNKNEKGQYCIATPTAGFAAITDEGVVATYRHTYHQAFVPVDVYEETMTAIFNYYHNIPYDKEYINNYISKNLALEPAQVTDEEAAKVFFAQHVALECIYHLHLTDYYDQILPFLNDKANFHNAISGARALRAYNTDECNEQLLKIIEDKSYDPFVQVMCVWTLSAFNPADLKDHLTKIKENASDEKNGFGGNIMDPRVCTHIPTVKEALNKLITSL